MVLELWTSRKLYRALKDDRFESIPSHFRDTYFSETHFSGEKDIIWANLPIADRRMAPFVLPTEQGKPIFRAAPESVKAISPPYMKPKDPVRAVDAKNPRISTPLTSVTSSTTTIATPMNSAVSSCRPQRRISSRASSFTASMSTRAAETQVAATPIATIRVRR